MLKLCCVYCSLVFLVLLSACGQEKTVTKTVIQTKYSTVYTPFLRYTTVYVPVLVTEKPDDPPAEQLTPILTDSTGAVALISITPLENFRTDTKVNFSTIYQFRNLSTERVNYGWTLSGKDAAGVTVFTWSLSAALDGLKTTTSTYSYGERLTISQYDSITNWMVSDLIRY